MIRRLRVRHRRIFLALALLLPATVAAGLASRARFPVVAGPPLLAGETATLDFAGLRVQATHSGSRLLLRPLQDPRAPDVAIIWSAERQEDGVVIGTLAGTQPVEVGLPGHAGRLFLFSLGHGELLGSAELPWD